MDVIEKTKEHVRGLLEGESSGHDWWHTYRVWRLAKSIGEKEGVDLFVTELAAILHDIADWKFNEGDESKGPEKAGEILSKLGVDSQTIEHVKRIIYEIPFKGAKTESHVSSPEGLVVQDADRLDAIAAIGIARCFAFGGRFERAIHDPNEKPKLHESFEDYKKRQSKTAITHFYEKLLLLKDKMNTKTAKEMAEHRHGVMEDFLKEFFDEWDGRV